MPLLGLGRWARSREAMRAAWRRQYEDSRTGQSDKRCAMATLALRSWHHARACHVPIWPGMGCTADPEFLFGLERHGKPRSLHHDAAALAREHAAVARREHLGERPRRAR